MPDEITDTTVQLLRDAIHTGFENVASRLSTQDAVLENVQREVRKTNGRVTALETRNSVTDGKDEVIDQSVIREHESLVRKRDRIRFAMTIVAMCFAGGIGTLIAHFWG